MSIKLEIVDDPARACSAMLLSAMLGGGDVVLTGGSTPKPAYEELARAVRAVGHDLRDTTLWFSDDRCVAPDNELSNYRLVKQSLLDPLADMPRPAVRRPRMPGPAALTPSRPGVSRRRSRPGSRRAGLSSCSTRRRPSTAGRTWRPAGARAPGMSTPASAATTRARADRAASSSAATGTRGCGPAVSP